MYNFAPIALNLKFYEIITQILVALPTQNNKSKLGSPSKKNNNNSTICQLYSPQSRKKTSVIRNPHD